MPHKCCLLPSSPPLDSISLFVACPRDRQRRSDLARLDAGRHAVWRRRQQRAERAPKWIVRHRLDHRCCPLAARRRSQLQSSRVLGHRLILRVRRSAGLVVGNRRRGWCGGRGGRRRGRRLGGHELIDKTHCRLHVTATSSQHRRQLCRAEGAARAACVVAQLVEKLRLARHVFVWRRFLVALRRCGRRDRCGWRVGRSSAAAGLGEAAAVLLVGEDAILAVAPRHGVVHGEHRRQEERDHQEGIRHEDGAVVVALFDRDEAEQHQRGERLQPVACAVD
mmetsp:Transcript_8511/g.20396  ORF Transcript_8511/g.20396 Transcript_8511/m.20396 type:complete len:279 (+) Transcript_8511:251-1087(+)